MKESLEFNKHYLGYALPLAGLMLLPTGAKGERRHRDFLRDLPDFFHFHKGREGLSTTEPLLAIMGSLCGLRPGERAKVVESEELRFRFLFSCSEPPGQSQGKINGQSRRRAWDDFLGKVLEKGNLPPSCVELERVEDELDGLFDELDALAAKAEEMLNEQANGQFKEWCDWVREPDDRERPPLPEMPEDFFCGEGGRNRFVEKLPWLRRRKQEFSDRLGQAIDAHGGIRCDTVTIERLLGTYSFQPRLITLYTRMMRLVLPSLLNGLPFLCTMGHAFFLRSLAVFPDGRLASARRDDSILIWDPTNGASKVLTGHVGSVYCLTALPDGRLASGGDDNTIRIWDLGSGVAKEFKGHTSDVLFLTVLPEGKLASGSADGTIRVWDTSNGDCMELKGHRCCVKCMVVLPDGRLASGYGSYNNTDLRIWDVSRGTSMELKGHQGGINCLAVLSDGRLASGSYDNTIHIWDTSVSSTIKCRIKTP